jgi:signal transduction histidine kinase
VNADDVRGVQLLAAELLRDVERIAERGAARMQEMLPAYADVPRDALTPVTSANIRNLLEAIRDPDADTTRAHAQYRTSGITRARQGITSDEMLNGWRIGLEVVREQAHVTAEQLGIGKDELLEFVVATLQWGDIGMRASALAHHEAEIRELGRLVEQQAALQRVATLVAGGCSPAEVFAKVAEEVVALVGAEAALIQRYEQDGNATVVGSWATLDNLVEQQRVGPFRLGSRSKIDGDSVTALVYQTERAARFDDYEHAAGSIAAGVRLLRMRSAVGSPIVAEGHLWGAIVAATTRPEPLPADAESRIAQFTGLVATAISNGQAREEVQRLAEEQAALRRVATIVARERPAEEVFAAVAEEVGLLLGSDGAVIHRFDADGEATVVGSWRNAFRVGSRFKLDGNSVAASVYRTQQPARLDDPGLAAGARELGLRSAVGCPVVVNGRLWGAIAAASSSAESIPAGAESRIAQFTELVGTAIANTQVRSDLAASRARIVAAADEERRRVVRDLHDGAQQRLVHTIVTLKLAKRALQPDEHQVGALVNEALRHAETATNELRELAHGILPAVLTRGGLRAGAAALASRMSIPVAIEVCGDRLPSAVEATAYFTVAEALTNVAKHSRAYRATVKARLESHCLHVEVYDDGVGGAQANGTGLVGLKDRLAVLDGSLRVESPPDGGTRIAASIPLASGH